MDVRKISDADADGMKESVASEEIKEILPQAGEIYSEKQKFSFVLCKPKIMPIKSKAQKKLEKIEKTLRDGARNSPSSG